MKGLTTTHTRVEKDGESEYTIRIHLFDELVVTATMAADTTHGQLRHIIRLFVHNATCVDIDYIVYECLMSITASVSGDSVVVLVDSPTRTTTVRHICRDTHFKYVLDTENYSVLMGAL